MSAQIIPRLLEFRKCQHKIFPGFRSSGNVSTNYSKTFGVPKMLAQIILRLPEFRKCRHKLFRDFRTPKCVGNNYLFTEFSPNLSDSHAKKRKADRSSCRIHSKAFPEISPSSKISIWQTICFKPHFALPL